jgi:hypothetical protein
LPHLLASWAPIISKIYFSISGSFCSFAIESFEGIKKVDKFVTKK